MADGPDEDFALTLLGDGISIEKKVNKQVAMAVVAAVLSGGAATAPVERVQADDGPSAKPALSPREFLAECRASTNAEQITALGHYICEYEAKDNFSKDDIKEGFRRAHEAIPKNLPRDVSTAIKSGLVHEAPGKAGRYYVTNTGMQLVASKFGRAK
jgi:hypothetical protein